MTDSPGGHFTSDQLAGPTASQAARRLAVVALVPLALAETIRARSCRVWVA